MLCLSVASLTFQKACIIWAVQMLCMAMQKPQHTNEHDIAAQPSHVALYYLTSFAACNFMYHARYAVGVKQGGSALPATQQWQKAIHQWSCTCGQLITALWVQERKASKLERKKQAKADSGVGSASQASAGNSNPATPSSFASVCPAEATNGVVDIAQPSQTDCARGEPAQDAEGTVSDVNAKDDRRRENLGAASDQLEAADRALKTQQNGQHQQLGINIDKGHEPAEPPDVLQEFESLSPMLPDMPKHDKGDDLAGLFQAAFATCRNEMSPRGRPPQSPFSSHGQDHDEEDFSLYNDADEVLGDDKVEGTALDASDDEEEGKQGEVAGAVLESFMGDAEHAACIQASHSAQVCCVLSSVCSSLNLIGHRRSARGAS